MSIASVKLEAGYLKATERDRCGNCKHCQMQYVDRAPPWDTSWLKCVKHDFRIAAGSICDGYEADRVRAIAHPPPQL
jgi:hypothetical protein